MIFQTVTDHKLKKIHLKKKTVKGLIKAHTHQSLTYIIMYTEDNVITVGASHGYGEANNTTNLPRD